MYMMMCYTIVPSIIVVRLVFTASPAALIGVLKVI